MIRVLVILVAFCAFFASANTEIKNFHVGYVQNAPGDAPLHLQTGSLNSVLNATLHAEVYTLNVSHNEQSFRVPPAPLGTPLQAVCGAASGRENEQVGGALEEGCSHELWLELDLSAAEWKRYDRFTIRLSWPASYPTDFDIALFSPQELGKYVQERLHESYLEQDKPSASQASLTSRTKYARIRLVDTGIRPPPNARSALPSLYGVNSAKKAVEAVPFTVIVEPLLFGFLPATLVPSILFLIPLLGIVGFAYPYVMRYLEDVAAEARKELYGPERMKKE